MNRRRVVAAAALSAVLAATAFVVETSATGCDGQPTCVTQTPFTIETREMIGTHVCAIVNERVVLRAEYRTLRWPVHRRRYIGVTLVPQQVSVRLTRACGEDRPERVDTVRFGVIWRTTLSSVQAARIPGPADQAPDSARSRLPRVFTATDAATATAQLTESDGLVRSPTLAAQFGLDNGPCVFGVVVVEATRRVGAEMFSDAGQVGMVRICPEGGLTTVPVS